MFLYVPIQGLASGILSSNARWIDVLYVVFLFVTDISFLEVNVLTECEDRLLQTCQTCQIVLCIFVVEKLSYSA